MKSSIHAVSTSLLVIALGVTWLLNTLGILPGVNWIWIGGLAFMGLLILVLGGINKFTFVTGPLLIIASVLSVLRQTGRLELDHEIPILVIVLGVLMLIAQVTPIPVPDWMKQPTQTPK